MSIPAYFASILAPFFTRETGSPQGSRHPHRVCHKTEGEAERLQGFRRDPLREKIREVGRGLSLADTQTGRYVRLYSRRRLCARRGADARLLLLILLTIFSES